MRLVLRYLFLFIAALPVFCYEAGPSFVTYEDFGAEGDGKTNDLPAIVKAHEYANREGLPVKAKEGAIYYIGDGDVSAKIQTDTDFTDARFFIDDTAVAFEHRRCNIFVVEPEKPSYPVNLPLLPSTSTSKLGMTFDTPILLVVQNKNVRHFIRWGANQNDGVPASDAVLVDKSGILRKTTPFVWDFTDVTSATAYPIDDKPITLKGGEFYTIANQQESKYNYYARGILVRRSNVTLQGIEHYVKKEGEHGAPYSGFFQISNCANVTLKNLVVTGHRMYNTIGTAGTVVGMGSYDMNADRAINVSFLNIRQSNDINDAKYWGVLGTNFCRNLLYDGCRVSRFDAHQGVSNAIIRNSELGHQGINLIGYGFFLLENTIIHNLNLINLRLDYGSFWRGKIVVRNCTLAPLDHKDTPCLIAGEYTGKHNFGYRCQMPAEIMVDGLKILDGKDNKHNGPCVFSVFNENFVPGYKETFPYVRTKKVVVRNVTVESGKPMRTALRPEFFADTDFDIQ